MGRRLARLALLGGLAALTAAGCIQERPAINQVQPDYLDKMDFIPVEYDQLSTSGVQPETLTTRLLAREPVFYSQTTMISKPTTSGFTGLTSYGATTKVRFEVTENFLIARQAFQYVHNVDSTTGSAGIGGNPRVGDVVAVYHIDTHFDIRRQYNPTTGEELNVITENSTDRPWYQRRYMRVDWSQNLVNAYNSVLMFEEWSGQVQSAPVPIYINNPQDPNAPVFQYAGDGSARSLQYFDIVNRAVLQPPTINFGPDSPAVPACLLSEGWDPSGGQGSGDDCAPSEVTFRQSFRRYDPQRDYEPASLTEALPHTCGSDSDCPAGGTCDAGSQSCIAAAGNNLNMNRFGFFDATRIGFDPTQHAVLDTQRQHFAARHNMWVWHHSLVFGTDTSTVCNTDSECSTGQACHIGYTAVNGHRGVCAPIAAQHADIDNNYACQVDDDCRLAEDGRGISNTATCDTSSHTCQDRFVRCHAEADCTAQDPNSHCDLAVAYTRGDNMGLCTMPYLLRQVRPVVYHETPNYPNYMQPVTESIVTEWNSAFVQGVNAARIRECAAHNAGASLNGAEATDTSCNDPAITGYDPNYSATAGVPAGEAQFIYVGCHSPVLGADPSLPGHTDPYDGHTLTAAEVTQWQARGWDTAACGPQGTNARLGDLRFNQIGAIVDQDNQGYWGLANIAEDPETGEMVAGRGAVWQTITDFYANYAIDLVRVLNGDLSVDQITNGEFLVDSMRQLGAGRGISIAQAATARGASVADQVLNEPLRAPGAMSHFDINRTGLARMIPANAQLPSSNDPLYTLNQAAPGRAQRAVQQIAASRMLGDGTNVGYARLRALAGTTLEGRLVDQRQALLAPTGTVDPTALSPETVRMASPFQGQSPMIRRVMDNMRRQLSAWECEYDSVFADDILLGFAQRLSHGAPIDPANPDDAPVAFGGVPDASGRPTGQPWNFQNGDGTANYALMVKYATQFIHHGVLAHELGHSLGQRHNFTASADAINYNDNYWRIRGQGHQAHALAGGGTDHGIRPRFEYLNDSAEHNSFYSAEEITGRIDEWSYSSVMDYKGFNEDAHGIGRYDFAFIANGYLGMVQAFRTVASMDDALQYSFATAGNGFSTPFNLKNYPEIHGLHYSQIPQIFGTNAAGMPNIGDDNRYWAFTRETRQTPIAGWGTSPDGFSNVTADNHLLVPYRFDTDERAGLIWVDQRYDAGPDGFESLHYVAERYLNYYFANSFSRYRTDFRISKYNDRQWGRYVDQLHQTTQLMAFDLIEWGQIFGGSTAWQNYLTNPAEHGGVVNQAAMDMSADTFVAQLLMPEVGTHHIVPQNDGTSLVTPNLQNSSGFANPVNWGRYFESSWNNNAGFWWLEQLNRAGGFYDKTNALTALTDPALNLLGRDTPTDLRLFQLNFYTMYPNQMIRLFGGLLSEDYRDFAPIVQMQAGSDGITHPIARTHVATINLPAGALDGTHSGRVIDDGHQPMDPQTHFTTEEWAAIMTTAEFPATFDTTYMDYSRIWLDGSAEAVDVTDPAANTVSFTNPWSHETYRALHFGAAAGESGAAVGASATLHPSMGGAVANEAGIGARMLLHVADLDARRLATTGTVQAQIEADERAYLDTISIQRSATIANGGGFVSLH